METATMGNVLVKAEIANVNDLLNVKAGTLDASRVRVTEVTDAMVDTGSKLQGLPKRYIEQLELERFETREARTAAGHVPTNIYRAVWLTIEGRRCTVDVAEVHDTCDVLIGSIPLELLDLVVDPINEGFPTPRTAASACWTCNDAPIGNPKRVRGWINHEF